MRDLSRLALISLLLLACVGCDQLSKHVARSELVPAETHSYLNDTVRLSLTENTGAFLGLGDSLPESAKALVFQGAVGLLVLGLLWFAVFSNSLGRWQIIALTMLAAGGLGNLIDRLVYDGRVTDFLNLGVGSLRTGIFNVADVVEVFGLIVYLLASHGAPQAANR